jgi:hypothetical protein
LILLYWTPMLSSSLCIWHTAHAPQKDNTMQSLQADPWQQNINVHINFKTQKWRKFTKNKTIHPKTRCPSLLLCSLKIRSYIYSLLTWMPPMVLILLLMTTVPPGTQYGIQQHSPVLEATLQIVQGRQKYPSKPVSRENYYMDSVYSKADHTNQCEWSL